MDELQSRRDKEISKLEIAKNQALSERNALNYYNSINDLGIEAEDPSLWEAGRADALTTYKPGRFYGNGKKIAKLRKLITKRDLNRLSYGALGTIFHGIWNLKIPHEMTNVMNADEAVAKYFAAARFKRGNKHLATQYSRDFLGLIRAMDNESYSVLGAELSEFKKFFPSKPGEQIARLNSLSSIVKDSFVNSFKEKYRPSDLEHRFDPDCYADPGSKDIYVASIYRFLNKPKS